MKYLNVMISCQISHFPAQPLQPVRFQGWRQGWSFFTPTPPCSLLLKVLAQAELGL